jgi:hypothetical protein
METEIRECPYCGGRGEVVYAGRGYVAVQCVQCKARSQRIDVNVCINLMDAVRYAIKKWNRRVSA